MPMESFMKADNVITYRPLLPCAVCGKSALRARATSATKESCRGITQESDWTMAQKYLSQNVRDNLLTVSASSTNIPVVHLDHGTLTSATD